MEVYVKESDRWLRQAEYDIKVAEWNLEGRFYAPACFWAQQAAAKGLRAFLFFYSEDARESRSVSDLLDRALTYEEEFKNVVGSSTNLDLYYKTSRFPDALPGGIPADVLTEKDAKEAITKASDIIRIVEKKRKGFIPETM
jgi:HEPN domain-containing protein